jgi:hypothetical protein
VFCEALHELATPTLGLRVGQAAHRPHLAVNNPLDVARTEDVVDLPLSEVLRHVHAKAADQIVVVDDETKQRLPSQTYSTTGVDASADRFLVLVKVPAHASLHLMFQREAHLAAVEPLVFGREAPERKELGPLEAADGALMFGVSTAMVFAVIVRLIQTRHVDLKN